MSQFFKNYNNIIMLLLGILSGSLVAIWLPDVVSYLKPLGDIFLNLLFVSVIPLLFFAISTSVASISATSRLGAILATMSLVFIVTIMIASLLTIVVLWVFPVTAIATSTARLAAAIDYEQSNWADRFVQFVSVSEFAQLLSRQHILALVVFSFLVGIAVRKSEQEGAAFQKFLFSGNEVMKNLLMLIMKFGPLGLGAYFAYQVRELGPELVGFYAKPLGFYYLFGTVFFLAVFTFYAFVASGRKGVLSYWKHNITPSLIAISTCSSLATLPANLIAARKMGVPANVANVVVPLGNTLYKNGSAISSILKIYVAFSILGWNFFELETMALAACITLLVSVVAGGIPNGGFIGEMLMISIYGIPNEAVPAVMIIGALVDPLATILNATGDTVAAMLVTRFSGERFEKIEQML